MHISLEVQYSLCTKKKKKLLIRPGGSAWEVSKMPQQRERKDLLAHGFKYSTKFREFVYESNNIIIKELVVKQSLILLMPHSFVCLFVFVIQILGEWITGATCSFIANYLVTNYNISKRVRHHVEDNQMICLYIAR